MSRVSFLQLTGQKLDRESKHKTFSADSSQLLSAFELRYHLSCATTLGSANGILGSFHTYTVWFSFNKLLRVCLFSSVPLGWCESVQSKSGALGPRDPEKEGLSLLPSGLWFGLLMV